jgi:hypothetical protein
MHRWQNTPNGTWSDAYSLGGVAVSEPVAGLTSDGRIEVFVIGTDGALWHQWQTAPNSALDGWFTFTGNPTAGF